MASKKGFTLIELLVVFFVFAILLSFVFIGYRQDQQKMILDSVAYKLVADIRKQQVAAGLDDTNCSKTNYKYSYGLYFSVINSGQYDLFSDCDGSNAKNSPPDNLTIINFPDEVELESVSPSFGGAINIAFYPPKPSLIVNNDINNSDSAVIVIHLKSNTAIKKTIIINKTGMIDID